MKQTIKVNILMKFLMLAVYTTCVFGTQAALQITNNPTEVIPEREVNINGNSITVTYNISEIVEVIDNVESNMKHHSIPGFGQCSEEGKPMLPMRIDTFRVPYGFDITLSTFVGQQQTLPCIYSGVPTPEFENSPNPKSLVQTSSFEGIFPAQNCEILTSYNLRGEKIIEIAVSPIQYDFSNGEATITPNLSYTIKYTPSESMYTLNNNANLTKSQSTNNTFLDEFLTSALVENVNEIGGFNLCDTEGFEGSVGYIVLTTDKYLDYVKYFERWKKILGYTTHIISRPTWNNHTEVLSAIRECRKMNDNIQYLLIIGDYDDVPSMISYRLSKSHCYDGLYGTLPEGGFIPDIYIGRIPVNNTTEINNVLKKLIWTEMCPIIDENFYKNAVHCAKFEIKDNAPNMEDRRFVLTSEEIRDYVHTKGITSTRFYNADSNANPQYYSNKYSFGQAIPAELQIPNFNWDCNVSDIIKQINNGCLYALYRGHGLRTGWAGVGLYTSTLPQLSNNELYPIIFSITCLTGKFNENCFAEQILKMPEAGALAVIASSEASLSGYNDSLIEGMFDAIWPSPGLLPRFNDPSIGFISKTPNPTYRLGHILEQGLFRMNEQWGTVDKDRVKYQYELFHLFGDPSMYFFTENPKQFSNVEISRDWRGIYVNTNGEPASISFYNSMTDTAHKYETDKIFYHTDDQENTIVCLTGHNRLTYLDGITIPLSEDFGYTPSYRGNAVTYSSIGDLHSITPETSFVTISDINGKIIKSIDTESDINISDVEFPSNIIQGVYIVTKYVDGVIKDTKKIII